MRSPTRRASADRVVLGRDGRGSSRPGCPSRRSPLVEQTRDAVESELINRSASSRLATACLMRPRGHQVRLAIRSLTTTRSTRRYAGAGLGRIARPAERVRPASVVAARRNQCSLANSTWPNWWRPSAARPPAAVRRRRSIPRRSGSQRPWACAGASVRVVGPPGGFELHQDASNGGPGHAEAVALDERRLPTGCAVVTYSSMTARRPLRAAVQAAIVVSSTRQARSPADLNLDRRES